MSKNEQKRKRIDLSYTEDPLSKRSKQNDDLHSPDGESREYYVAHVVNELPQSISLNTIEMIPNTTTTTSPLIQLDAEETIEQLKQRVIEINNAKLNIFEIQRQLIGLLAQVGEPEIISTTGLLYDTKNTIYTLFLEEQILQKKIEEIQKVTLSPFNPLSKSAIIPPPVIIVQHNTDERDDTSEKTNFNREQYIELYGKFNQLLRQKTYHPGKAGALMTYIEPAAPQLKLYYLTGEMVTNSATIEKVNRLTFCNGKQVIEGRTLVSGKIYFYLESNPLKTDQLFATDLIPPHAVPVKTPGSQYSTYKGRQVIQMCLTAVTESPGKIMRGRAPDYSAHYAFHTKALNVINNTTIHFTSRSSYKHQILVPLVTNSVHEEKNNQSYAPLSGIQTTSPAPSYLGIFTTANNESTSPQSPERKNESPTVAVHQPTITINQIIMVQENATPPLLPSFNHLLSSLSIFTSSNNRSSSLPVEEKERKESTPDVQLKY